MPHDSHDHDHTEPPSDLALRVKALETALTRKGYVNTEAIDAVIDTFENKIGPRNGAKVVAKAWSCPDFKKRLLDDASAACAELGFTGQQGEQLKAVENTSDVHNLVVCTLCSCYPWPVLGLPPSWYKSHAYRSRSVIEPREVLKEFDVAVPENKEVRVWDSTAELRYLVLPTRPDGTENLSEEELADLVTRDSMIGAGIIPSKKTKS
ncbi:MAG: nitrile hydratase subunit alpha [Rhodospirillaceae bacterium]